MLLIIADLGRTQGWLAMQGRFWGLTLVPVITASSMAMLGDRTTEHFSPLAVHAHRGLGQEWRVRVELCSYV